MIVVSVSKVIRSLGRMIKRGYNSEDYVTRVIRSKPHGKECIRVMEEDVDAGLLKRVQEAFKSKEMLTRVGREESHLRILLQLFEAGNHNVHIMCPKVECIVEAPSTIMYCA